MPEPIKGIADAENGEDKPIEKVERRSNWTMPPWFISTVVAIVVPICATAFAIYRNDSVQDTKIEHLMRQTEESKVEARSLRGEIEANKTHVENFSAEALDLMRRLAEQDRFRKQR